jgi:hypothetical protein
MPIERRADVLGQFWRTCAKHRPPATGDSPQSFYDVDNDSLMAGFSGVTGMYSGRDVLLWTLYLHNLLTSLGVPVSFGAVLATGRDSVDWSALPGFLPQLRRYLYFPDDEELLDGRVDRRRLIGDPLILAARLLSLAKKANAGIAFAFAPSEDSQAESITNVQMLLQGMKLAPAFSLSREMRHLPIAHQEWVEHWHVEPYGLVRGSAHNPSPGT